MKEVFETLKPIKESTGLDIDLYSGAGSLLFSTDGERPAYKYKHHAANEFTDGTISDRDADVTYFLCKSAPQGLIGVIAGSNEVSRNYAVMVSQLIEKTLLGSKIAVDKEERFRLLFRGELNKLQLESLKSGYREASFNYYVLSLVVKPSQKMDEVISLLQTVSDGDDVITRMDENTVAYIKKCGGADEYSSANDFAYILHENIIEELRVNVKISVGGTVHKFDDLATAYRNSLFAHNFGSLLDPNSGVYSYKEYVMVKMLSDIPKDSLAEYFDTLLDKSSIDILKDEELMNTADVFMKNSLNISETSRNMYMHRNTLIYRLDKIENATGLNIRHFNDALTFRLITMLNKLIKK